MGDRPQSLNYIIALVEFFKGPLVGVDSGQRSEVSGQLSLDYCRSSALASFELSAPKDA